MIPEMIDRYLRDHALPYEHLPHRRAVGAQRLAASEHVTGRRIAKPVVVRLDGKLALAVVNAAERLDLDRLQSAADASRAELVPEDAFAEQFAPCEAGAEPALSMFGLPIWVDAELAAEPWIVMRGGTHEDAIRIDTQRWLDSEDVRVGDGLGRLARSPDRPRP
jgi:Ala-tRNA(Pro) deacylase